MLTLSEELSRTVTLTGGGVCGECGVPLGCDGEKVKEGGAREGAALPKEGAMFPTLRERP